MREYDDLFRGQLKAVLDEFDSIMAYYNTEIQTASERLKTLLADECLGEDGEVDIKKKRIRDYDLLTERKNIGFITDKKVKLLLVKKVN